MRYICQYGPFPSLAMREAEPTTTASMNRAFAVRACGPKAAAFRRESKEEVRAAVAAQLFLDAPRGMPCGWR